MAVKYFPCLLAIRLKRRQLGYSIRAGYENNAGYSTNAGDSIAAGYSIAVGYSLAVGYSIAAGYSSAAGHSSAAGYSIPVGYSIAAGYSRKPLGLLKAAPPEECPDSPRFLPPYPPPYPLPGRFWGENRGGCAPFAPRRETEANAERKRDDLFQVTFGSDSTEMCSAVKNTSPLYLYLILYI